VKTLLREVQSLSSADAPRALRLTDAGYALRPAFAAPPKRVVPAWLEARAEKAHLPITKGIPQHTWNGMSEETHAVGAKDGGTRSVHLLPPGLHPTPVAEAKQRFAWNDTRRVLWDRLAFVAPQLRALGISHVAGAGSFFTTDHATPGDIDLVAFAPTPPARQNGRTWFAELNTRQGEHGVHVYWNAESILFPGGPSVLDSGLRNAPPNPRPRRFDFSAKAGPEVGLVLIDLAQFH